MFNNSPTQVAFTKGFQAFMDGHDSTNPFAIFTTANRAWFQGYEKARKARARGAC